MFHVRAKEVGAEDSNWLATLVVSLVIALTGPQSLYAQTQEPAADRGLLVNLFEKGDKEEKDQPLFIKSNSVMLNSKERYFTYHGNVEVMRGDLLITADVMTGTYDQSDRLQQIVAEKNVVITKGNDLRASSNRAEYDVENAVIVLTEGPEVVERGNALSADKVTVYLQEDRSVAEGEVRVKVIAPAAGNNK